MEDASVNIPASLKLKSYQSKKLPTKAKTTKMIHPRFQPHAYHLAGHLTGHTCINMQRTL